MKALLIIVSVLVLLIVVLTITVGRSTFEGIVVKEPYETGLRWDSLQRERANSAWSVSLISRRVVVGRNDIVISVKDAKGLSLRDAQVDVVFSRPSTDQYDRTVHAVVQSDGNFHAMIDLPLPGRWSAEITVRQGARSLPFDDEVVAQ